MILSILLYAQEISNLISTSNMLSSDNSHTRELYK